ncbi:MAG: hypothetical protein ABI614_04620 [Planctomycetota bacterium]
MTKDSLGDRSAAEPQLPAGNSRRARRGETALVMSTWQGLMLVSVASLAVWGTLEAIMPVFLVPGHLQSFGNDATAALKQEQRDSNALCRAKNATLSIALLASTLALSLAAAELLLRGERLRAIWGGLLAGLMAAAIVIGAGAVGATSIEALALPDHRLFKTMIVQSGVLGALGLAVGLGISLALFRVRLLVTCAGGCLLGGLLAAFLFPIAASILMPRLNTEFLMPDAGIGRLFWIGLAAGLIGVAVTGLGKERSRSESGA